MAEQTKALMAKVEWVENSVLGNAWFAKTPSGGILYVGNRTMAESHVDAYNRGFVAGVNHSTAAIKVTFSPAKK